jgi:hypothetical protein
MISMRILLAAAVSVSVPALGLRAASAVDAPSAAPAQASLSFASTNIFTWESDGEKGIWVQAIGHQWYYGTFMSPCTGLQFHNGVHFRFGPNGELDRWGAVIVPHVPECFFKSFTVSDGPPTLKKAKPPAVTAPTPSATAPSAPTA